jgi:hypothetical protein
LASVGSVLFLSKPVAEKRRRSFAAEHREDLARAMRAWHEKRKARRLGENRGQNLFANRQRVVPGAPMWARRNQVDLGVFVW